MDRNSLNFFRYIFYSEPMQCWGFPPSWCSIALAPKESINQIPLGKFFCPLLLSVRTTSCFMVEILANSILANSIWLARVQYAVLTSPNAYAALPPNLLIERSWTEILWIYSDIYSILSPCSVEAFLPLGALNSSGSKGVNQRIPL